MKVLQIVNGNDVLEIQYNEQDFLKDVSPHISEAQLFVKGTRANGGVHFEIDEIEDMDAVIALLTEIRAKMVAHNSKDLPIE